MLQGRLWHSYNRATQALIVLWWSSKSRAWYAVQSKCASTVKEYIVCTECERPRVIYAARKLSFAKVQQLTLLIQMAMYTCGCLMQNVVPNGDTHPVLSKVYTRANLSCTDCVEVPYYSCEAFNDICIHCTSSENLVADTNVYPTCQECYDSKPKQLCRKRKHFEPKPS